MYKYTSKIAFYFYYSGWGASTGQTPAQEPHSIQVFASITYLSSPEDIHSTGHSASQAPQLIQASFIKAIYYYSVGISLN